jgi:tetratricopeptide (TPR) repeat protein
MAPYYQSVAGYYAGIGDLYLQASDYLSAAEYYKLSNIYSGTSHRANYALATMERRSGNSTEEIEYLKKAIGKHPTPFAYVNLSTKLLENKRELESIFTLQDGLEHFGDNAYLLNNLGLAYLAINSQDSAFFYLNNAQYSNASLSEPSANIYALLSKQELYIREDTLDFLLQNTEDQSSLNNLVVLANDLKKSSMDRGAIKFGDPRTEKPEQLVYNYNKTINLPTLVDSSYLETMKVFYDSSNVSWFQDNLYFASALALYRQGNISAALGRLNLLAVQNPEKSYYSFLGKICLGNKAFDLAINNFKNAFQNGHLEIAAELAFAYMESGDLERAGFVWRQIEFGGDSVAADIARNMLNVIEADRMNDLPMTDTTLFSLVAYRYMDFDPEQLEGLILGLSNEDIKALGVLRLFSIYLDLGRHDKAFQMLQELAQLNISERNVLEEINLAQCQFAFHTKDEDMKRRLYTDMESDHRLVNNYLQLFRSMAESTTSQAESTIELEQLVNRNPFFEDGILAVAEFFNTTILDQDRAYDILLNSVNLNPFSIRLNQAYALQCLRVGLNNYAMDTMEELKTMMPSAMFKTFETEFLTLFEDIESRGADW